MRHESIGIMNGQKKRAGFTLLEVLVVTAVLVIVAVILAEIYIGQSLFFQREQARVEVALVNTRALNDIVHQTREAFRVVTSTIFDSVTYTTGPEKLILELPSLDAQGQIIASAFDYAVYYREPLDLAKLMKKVRVSPASRRPLAVKNLNDHVNNLNFVYDNADLNQVRIVEVYLSSAQTVGGMNFQASSTVRALLRNK